MYYFMALCLHSFFMYYCYVLFEYIEILTLLVRQYLRRTYNHLSWTVISNEETFFRDFLAIPKRPLQNRWKINVFKLHIIFWSVFKMNFWRIHFWVWWTNASFKHSQESLNVINFTSMFIAYVIINVVKYHWKHVFKMNVDISEFTISIRVVQYSTHIIMYLVCSEASALVFIEGLKGLFLVYFCRS